MLGRSRGLRLSAAVLCTTLAAAASVALAGPATAAVPGHQLVTVDSAATSGNKSFSAVCPANKRVIGSAASIFDGAGQVVIDAVVPGPTMVTAIAYEDDDGFSGSWYIRVTAVCATAPAGLEYVFADNGPVAGPVQAKSASCPGAKQALGSGFEVMGGFGEVWVTDADASATSTMAIANEDEDGSPNTGAWNLRTWVICANPLAGWEVVIVDSPSDSTDKTVPAACPLGKVALGAGFTTRNAAGEITAGTRLAGRTVTAVAKEDQSGVGGTWEIGATVTCATA